MKKIFIPVFLVIFLISCSAYSQTQYIFRNFIKKYERNEKPSYEEENFFFGKIDADSNFHASYNNKIMHKSDSFVVFYIEKKKISKFDKSEKSTVQFRTYTNGGGLISQTKLYTFEKSKFGNLVPLASVQGSRITLTEITEYLSVSRDQNNELVYTVKNKSYYNFFFDFDEYGKIYEVPKCNDKKAEELAAVLRTKYAKINSNFDNLYKDSISTVANYANAQAFYDKGKLVHINVINETSNYKFEENYYFDTDLFLCYFIQVNYNASKKSPTYNMLKDKTVVYRYYFDSHSLIKYTINDNISMFDSELFYERYHTIYKSVFNYLSVFQIDRQSLMRQ